MTDPPVIAVEGVCRAFGRQIALENATLAVPPGRCFGLLGPNGAGKTTLIRILLGLARADAGRVEVCGHASPGEARAALAKVGGVVEAPCFHGHLTGRENLRFWAALTSDPQAAEARSAGVLARAGLADAADRRVAGYSMGMRQRLGVARALVGDPALLILDEPNSALDAEGSDALNAAVREMKSEGRAVIIMTHRPMAIAECDDLVVLEGGMVKSAGPRDQVLNQTVRNANQLRAGIAPAQKAG